MAVEIVSNFLKSNFFAGRQVMKLLFMNHFQQQKTAESAAGLTMIL